MKKRVHKKAAKKSRTKVRRKPKAKSPSHERVKTGIPNFDVLVGGGFEKDSTNMLVGSAGSGKSIFAVQFLVDGMSKGEKCLYVTFEEKKAQFYRNMKEFGWDLADYEKRGLLTFIEYTPEKVRLMLEEGGGAIESIILSKKVKRIIIDSITSFELLFGGEYEKREAALSLFNMINNWGCTSIVTLEENADIGSASRALEFESDSIVLLYFIRNKDSERQRYIEVLKMRGTEHSKKLYKFDIGKHGIILNKKSCKEVI
jgi:KaiC/GvpD/RAD55 family RecA-like ATPase